MFTSDFAASDTAWPIFGAGPRACAGAALGLPLLRAVDEVLRPLGPEHFRPQDGHRFSGRNNDGTATPAEVW